MTSTTIIWSDRHKAALTAALKEFTFAFDGMDDVGVHSSLGEACIRQCAHQSGVVDLAPLELLATSQFDDHLVIKNMLDCSAIPPTPVDDRVPPTTGWHHVISCILGALSIAGTRPGAFLHEKEGRLCHMVAPAKVNDEALHRTTKPLHYHTEVVSGALPGENLTTKGQLVSPDVIALGCLRNPNDVGTTLLPIERILENLPFSVIKQLQKPNFAASSQSSFDVATTVTNIPVLIALEGGCMAMRYSRSKLVGTTPEAKHALQRLTDFLDQDEFGTTVLLKPGDILLLNNRTCLHRRVAIKNTAQFDGTDRWLIRIYGFSHDAWRKAKRSPDRQHVIIPTDK